MSLPMLQVALDNQTMDSAYETTRQIAEEVDIIEVGTILCVGEGVRAVRDLKALYPHKIVLADAKIADAGKILSRMCFEANADWVTVICCADINTAKGAAAYRRYSRANAATGQGQLRGAAASNRYRLGRSAQPNQRQALYCSDNRSKP